MGATAATGTDETWLGVPTSPAHKNQAATAEKEETQVAAVTAATAETEAHSNYSTPPQ